MIESCSAVALKDRKGVELLAQFAANRGRSRNEVHFGLPSLRYAFESVLSRIRYFEKHVTFVIFFFCIEMLSKAD
jgi:hypothetical protein